MPARRYSRDITLHGKHREMDDAAGILDLNKFHELISAGISEGQARVIIQDIIDRYSIKATILYAGNKVYGKYKLLRSFRTCVKAGGPSKYFTDALYEFFSNSCGTIAHYNKAGWISVYPTNGHLDLLFKRNEYGIPILRHIPAWRTDSIDIATTMRAILDIQIN